MTDLSKLNARPHRQRQILVGEEQTAPRVGSGRVRVLATPVMINMMEAAALDAIENLLPPGHQSLGTHLDVGHYAATPVGMTLRATAEVTKIDGRNVTFRVEAFDDKERVGDGTHTRVVVNVERFDARIQKKLKGRRMSPRIAFIGFGEAGQAMAAGLREDGVSQIAAWDILFPDPAGATLIAAGETIGVGVAIIRRRRGPRRRDRDRRGHRRIELRSRAIGRRASAGNPFYLDVNSVSPGRKQATAKLLGDGARYVDVAIVSAIHPARHKSPMMLAGPHAAEAEPLLSALGDEDADRRRRGRRRRRDQDDPQRDDQGDRGADPGMLPRGVARRRGRSGRGVAARTIIPTSIGQDAEYNIERMASHGIRRARRCARSPTRCANSASSR